MQYFGPHSTRGAGVKLYKSLGLTSEQVCELGQWKNAGAFTSHYLRLGAAESAAQVLDPFLVHNVSSSKGAEPEGSWSPRTKLDLGRNDPEGEATKDDEPPHPPQRKKRERSPQANQEAVPQEPQEPQEPLRFFFKVPTAGAQTSKKKKGRANS